MGSSPFTMAFSFSPFVKFVCVSAFYSPLAFPAYYSVIACGWRIGWAPGWIDGCIMCLDHCFQRLSVTPLRLSQGPDVDVEVIFKDVADIDGSRKYGRGASTE